MEKIEKEQKKEEVYSYIQKKFVGGNNRSETPIRTTTLTAPSVKLSPFALVMRILMFVLIGFVSLVFGIGLVVSQDKTSVFFLLLFIISLILLFFGLVNPQSVFHRSRRRVLAYCGSSVILLFLLAISTSPTNDVTSNENQIGIKTNAVPVSTPAVTETREQFISSAKEIPYLDLARNPDKHKSLRVEYIGKVSYVTEMGNKVTLLVDVSRDEYGIWSDGLYINYERSNGEDRILENDIITIWGTVQGLKTYTAVLGHSVSLPEINAKYIFINEHEK